MKKVRFICTLLVAKMVLLATKIFRFTGSMISGKIAVMLQKDFVKYFTNVDFNKVIFVTGTNGKSTTTNLIAHTIEEAGKNVATNTEGANMMSGVASTLIKNSSLFGRFNKEFLILEIDERSLRNIYKVLPGKNLCISNLQKDQVQRNGDPDFIYKMFSDTINKDVTLFVNNEEPRSRALEDFAGKSIYFSMERNSKSFEKDDFYTVTLPCPKCNHKIEYEYYNIDNIGKFKCTNCDYESNDKPNVIITDIDYNEHTFKCGKDTYKVSYINPFYIYNYAVCIAVCKHFKIKFNDIQKGFSCFINPADRRETYKYKGKTIRYLRIKQENPETFQNALDTVARDNMDKAVFIGLYEIKDFPPAYTNTFYFFDCNFKGVVESNVEQFVSFSRTVCYDCANRMIYDGAPKDKLKIYNVEDDFDTIFETLDELETDNIYIITGMKPYKKIKAFFETKQ
ncbi:MAG: DUF1727 domain-containing protein [Clostridia bacterium]|nr:DUF1727 domain-containing protein [Clostridia bacterium]